MMEVLAGKLILRSTLTSPFGRKVRMAAEVLGLAHRLVVVSADPADAADTLRQQNPLGKIPCLVLEDGTSIYDSRVILEYLQHVVGSEQLLPLTGAHRFRMLTLMTLADGVIDAGALIIYEQRYHEARACSPKWLDHQRGKIQRALDAFERAPLDPGRTDAVAIGLGCALGFLDKRKVLNWRAGCPKLVEWLDSFRAREAAYERTRA